jgi:uncharacterized protein
MDQLIDQTRDYVYEYMKRYDPSHDFTHILRVLHNAHAIEASEHQLNPETNLDSNVITLAALLHDVGDRKYVQDNEDPANMVCKFLLAQGASIELAEKVQVICTNVSYSNETKNPQQVAQLCKEIPELPIVQDADRLDSIGATGIARLFAFSGGKVPERGLSVDHFYEKLIKLKTIMKTTLGRQMANERTSRLDTFLGWWKEETHNVEGLEAEMQLKRLAEKKTWEGIEERAKNGVVAKPTKANADLDAEDVKWMQETGVKKVDHSDLSSMV